MNVPSDPIAGLLVVLAEDTIDFGPAVSIDPRYVVFFHDSDAGGPGFVDLTEAEG